MLFFDEFKIQIITIPTTIHIHTIRLDVSTIRVKQYYSLLSPSEQQRAHKFRFQSLRDQYVVGRGHLRLLAGKYLDTSPAKLRFDYGAQGKPFLPDYPSFSFNISHTQDIAVMAFSENMTLGIDVEFIDANIDCQKLARRFFSKNEAHSLLNLPLAQQAEGFFNCWTRKEAYIKAKGGGLSIPLDQFEVSLLPDDVPRMIYVAWDNTEVDRWQIHSFTPVEGLKAALVFDKKDSSIVYL